jgi:hypothetical protein
MELKRLHAVTAACTFAPLLALTGDHPTEQLAFKGDGWIYWSQGSTTNSGVVGLDQWHRPEPVGHSVSADHPQQ